MDTGFPLHGGCTCRNVRYRMVTRPLFVHCCHCRWCQRETGASFALNALIEADRVVVTSDNPRSEDPLRIIDSVLGGMERRPAHVDPDRRAAIAWVVAHAEAGDAVLIAGKGHEAYQEIGGSKLPFDDREVARRMLECRP